MGRWGGGRAKTTPPTHLLQLMFLLEIFTQGTKLYILHFNVKKNPT